MNPKNLLLSALVISSTSLASLADRLPVSPTPQIVRTTGTNTLPKPTGLIIKALPGVEESTVKMLTNSLPKNSDGIKITIGLANDPQLKAIADSVPQQEEGYFLTITPRGVIIAGRDQTGLFYGAKTFLQLAQMDRLPQVNITDYPSIDTRGVIEGFYGNPWSFDDRVSQFEFYGDNKMNIYIYGPKDDPYHHSKWYEPYPQEEARRMSQLVQKAADNKVKFVWAMHPSNSIVTPEDRQKALSKLELMYDLGIRAFAIFFDDISAESVDDQVSYVNFLTDNFVKAHDDVEPMIVCPTQYNKLWSGGDYLSKMGNGLYPEVRIMWTGNSVIDMIDVADCEWFKGQTGREPFIWLNYPVNDFGLHHMILGPVVGNDSDITGHVSAFCSNPMQYAEASKVALYGIADYSWNPKAFDPFGSWERSFEILTPGHAEAFRIFCEDNDDFGPSVHTPDDFRMLESPGFKAIMDKYPELTPEAVAEYSKYFDRMEGAAEELLADKDQPRLINEIKEFIQYYDLQAKRGKETMAMVTALDNKKPDSFIKAYTAYSSLTASADSLMSRGFEGSIQSVAPRTGSLRVEPFISSTARHMAAKFREEGYTCPEGLFPTQVIDNGAYYITYDGAYLTNPSGSEFPVLQTEIDEVNPGRQLWIITYDLTSGRYKIVNEWDKRYINDRGTFGTTPYEPTRHTYEIIPGTDGKMAIRNGDYGDTYFWIVKDDRIKRGSREPDGKTLWKISKNR